MKNLLKLSTFIVVSLFFGHLSAQNFNYGEALQKSILFYETQQSGKLPDWNRISWRGDAGVTDGQDVGLDLTGGWFDAGDHIKFGFPMAFSVTSLNWGYLEYKEGYDAINQTEHFKRNIKWVTDYFIKCHVSPNEFYGQISAKNPDHNFWMPAEMVDVHPQYGQRQSYKIDTQNPGTELACETAAALASASIIFKDSDPAYSATLLRHAKELYEFGDTYRGKYNEEGNIPATGTYSSGGYEDELTWGALWLYKATGDASYLQKAEAEYTEPDYLWSLVWDDKRYGNMVLLAEITGKQNYKDNAERHLNFWLDNGEGIKYSPGGQAHLTQWGSLRHSMNASLTAFIYADKVETNASKKQAYIDFAIGQVNYALGDNPNNRSLVTGFGVNPPTKPHHRGQHSSWLRSEDIPVESRHTMWGALMGGPGRPNDAFVEDRGDFQANEVACDYNSCYQGVLARMVMQFGGNSLSNFPQPEPAGQEFLNEAKINSSSNTYTEIAIWLNNRSGWPARLPNTLRSRYFIDISEGIAAGYGASDYEVTGRGNGRVIGGLQAWDEANNIYYVEVEVDNEKMPFPGGRGEYRTEVQMRVGLPNQAPSSAWDPTNDFSYINLDSTLKELENIPIYADGVLVGGNEPGEGSGNRRPIAVINSDVISGIAPLPVSFDGSESSDADGDSLTYNWDFGNGQTSTSVDPLITFSETGSYLVSLTVNDGESTSLETTTTITVTDGSPIASFTVSADSGVAPLDVTLDASGSTDPTGGTLSYSWDLGNGQTANTVTTSAIYAEVGEVTVTLTVTNANGDTDTTSKTITIRDQNTGGDCAFGTPTSEALPGINDRFSNVYVLGTGGPNLDNIREFSINWDSTNNGLYTFAVNTNNGQPDWYVDLRPSLSYTFNTANPEATLSDSNIAGLDGSYYVTVHEGNFVMVSKTGGYTLYFTNASDAPDCGIINPPNVDGGTIAGGPFTFTVGDGIADNVSGITLTGNVGDASQWVVTDDQNNILGLPASPEDVNFDEAPAGVCLIWHLSYNGTISGAAVGSNASEITGDFDLSNSITVTRNEIVESEVDGGIISGGPFTFTVGDGIADNVSGITLTDNVGTSSQWVVTDDQNNILGLPASPEDVNFDEAPAGVCLIWHLSYNGSINGASVGNNASDLTGDFDLSNSITVTRNPISIEGDCTYDTPISGSLSSVNDRYDNVYVLGNGGPDLNTIREFSINWDLDNSGLYTFAVNTNNGQPDWYVDLRSSLTYSFNAPNPDATLSGTGIAGLDGSYWVTVDQGNFVMVSKNAGYTLYFTDSDTPPNCDSTNPSNVNGGTITGGPFTFTVGDGIADNVSDISLSGNAGENSQWVITDDQGTILGLPASPENVNFDEAPAGVCLIWHLSYNGAIEGAAVGNNASDLSGEFDLSNSITVNRNPVVTDGVDGATVSSNTGETEITTTTGDGQADIVVFTNTSGSTAPYIYIITDEAGRILTTETASHDFEGASVGICRVYGLSYTGELDLSGKSITDAGLSDGDFSVSTNSITVTREDIIIVNPPSGDNEYIDRFTEMRNEYYNPENGFFSADGSPHHSVETLIVEAPDHGHESTSELYSYWLWLEVMNGRITGDWQPVSDVWNSIEKFIIPTKEDQPTNDAYRSSSPAAYAGEFPLPSDYPAPLETSVPVGADPVSPDLTRTYGADVYQMHWLLDNDNFYGYGNRGDGVSTPSYINTFSRGEEESVYETVPHPSWESFDWGGEDGYLPLFIDDNNYAKQWRYTSAPDADARAVQAMYWAQQYAKEQGASLSNLDLDKASKMGDYLRLSMFDKYFKPLGVQNVNGRGGAGYDSAHYLMSWYISWGGSADPATSWAFRISSSHCHFGYQNPVAAYALSQVPELEPKSQNGKRDWAESLDRQMEFYTWLQSKEGAIAGGATNSWDGNYSTYPSGKSTFYDMAFDTDPVYHDPGSGGWFGWQVWSMERVAELYYINNDPRAKQLMDKWVNWVKGEVKLIGDNDFEVPATLEWTGEPDTWNADNPGDNSDLSVTVTDYSTDIGVSATLAKTLTYYAAATQKHDVLDTEARDLAREILDRMWITYRDEIGVSSQEERGDYKRLFEDEVYIPSGFSGTMPNGDAIEPGITFMDIRSGYENDPEYDRVKAAVDNGEDYTQRYHRGWAHIEVALANAEYGFFFGDDSTNKNPSVTTSETVFLSPVPALDYVDITSSFNLENSRVRIINIAGKVIKNFRVDSDGNRYRLSVNDLASGVYVVDILDAKSGQKRTLKLVKQD